MYGADVSLDICFSDLEVSVTAVLSIFGVDAESVVDLEEFGGIEEAYRKV